MTVDATALDRVRARLADAGADPTPTEVARALRRDGDLVGDAAVLEMVDALRREGQVANADDLKCQLRPSLVRACVERL